MLTSDFLKDVGYGEEFFPILKKAYTEYNKLECVKGIRFYTQNNCQRLYFDIWSQNKMCFISSFMFVTDVCYFCAKENNAFVKDKIFGKVEIVPVMELTKNSFSGAKTREKFVEFIKATAKLRGEEWERFI